MTPRLPLSRIGLLFLAVIVGAPSVAWALEPLGIYEDWQEADDLIRSDRWRGMEDFGGTEIGRQINSGAVSHFLVMRHRLEGFVISSTTPTGQLVARNHLLFTNPTSITEIAATFRVHRLTLTPCAANNSGTATQAGPTHIGLARFNDGTSTGPSDRTGDIEGVIATFRNGSSAEAAGVLDVIGLIIRSTSATGDFSGILGSVTLGTVTVGEKFDLGMAWDQPNKQFLFSLNGQTPQAVPYSVSDTAEAVVPFAQIFQRPAVANCHDAPAVVDVTTYVRKVRTNASAVIP